MQLLDTQPHQQLKTIPARLQDFLTEIVNQIQIESKFCIRHPDYKPIEVPPEAIEHFQKLPLELQDKYLSSQLQSFLYGIYYNGALRTVMASETDEDDSALPQDLENNTFLGVDLDFYEKLHQSNQGEGYFDPGWQVLREERDGSLAVTKRGRLTLHIDRQKHLQPEAQAATVGDVLAIRLPKNRVQNGFYMAIGNASAREQSSSDSPAKTIRIYFNLTPEGAVAVMESLTKKLNDISLPFSFKTLYNPSDYDRYDSAVLYFDVSYYSSVKQVIEAIYPEHQAYFRPEVPLFTKVLAPGLALAEEPDHKFSSQDSFGTNRCQIVANGLLEAWQQGDDSPEGRIAAILHHFSARGIELHRSYLNANAEDIYTPLEI